MALRSIKSNRARSAILMSAILLASFLVFALITVGATYVKMNQKQTIRLMGGDYDAILYGLTKEQRTSCENNPDISLSGIEAVAGYVKETAQDKTPDVGLLWADDVFWEKIKPPAVEWMKGSYPKQADEVLVTQNALKECGMEQLRVGDSFVMTYSTPKGDATKEFRISGMWSGYGGEKVFYVSKSFYEMSGQDLASVSSGRYYMCFEKPVVSQKAQAEFIENMNLSKKQRLFFVGENGPMARVLLGVIGLVAVTCLCAYLIIYNILYLIVVGNIRYYGLLQTIGMTGRQITGFIRIQMLYMGAGGLCGGLILGSVVSFGVVPGVIKSLGIRSGQVEVAFHPFILCLTILITVITLYIGGRKPIKIAAKVSAMEALTYSSVPTSKKTKRVQKGGIVWRLAKEQITKDKKKAFVVMLSLGASLSVFLCVVTLLESQDSRTVISNLLEHDFVVENETLGKEEKEEWQQTLTDQVLSQMGETKGVTAVFPQLSAEIVVPWEPEFSDMWMREFYDVWMEEPYEDAIEEYKSFPQNFGSFLVGIDERKFDSLNKTLKTPIDREKFLAGETCVLFQNELTFSLKQVKGKSLYCAPYDTPDQIQSFEIAGFTDERYFNSSLIGFPPTVIVADHAVKAFTSNWFVQKAAILYEEEYDAKTEQDVLSVLQNSDYPKDFSYESKIEHEKSIKKAQGNMMEIGIGMVFILMVIGSLNYVNTVSGSIQSRQAEFELLGNVGMTDRQIKKMLVTEGLIFAIGSLLIMGTAGLGVTYLIFQATNYNQVVFSVPLLPVAGMVFFVTMICIWIPLFIRRRVEKNAFNRG